MRGIRKRGDKWLVDVTVNGTRNTATADSMSEAVEKRDRLKLAMTTGQEIVQTRANAKAWTLGEALEKTLSLPAPEGWRGISYEKQAKLNVEDAIAYMGSKIELNSITRDQIDAWLHSCEAKGNSDSTINRKISGLSKVLKVALTYGGLDQLPNMPKQRKEPVGRIRQISPEEEDALLGYFFMTGALSWWQVAVVLIDTGMRCSELWNVRWEDYSPAEGVLMVYGAEGKGTKNGDIRSVPLTTRAKAVLNERRHLRTATSGPFCDYTNADLRRAWDKARAHLGLTHDKQFSPHVCRHTCASRLVRAGVTLPVVQAWLGHKNIQTTMRYAHLYPRDLFNAVKQLEGLNQ